MKERKPKEKPCEMCGNYHLPALGALKGLCMDCSDKLGGKAYSAAIVKQEAREMKKAKNK